MNGKKDEGVEVKLRRDLGLFHITMIGVGAMIGPGILILVGIGTRNAGPGIILAFMLSGVVALFTGMSYAELSSAFPRAGGGYSWVKECMPEPFGFLSGWMSWLANIVSGSLYSVGFGFYLAWLCHEFHLPVFGIPQGSIAIVFAILITIIFITINYLGVEKMGITQTVVSVLEASVLGVLVVFGAWAMLKNPAASSNFVPFLPRGFSGLLFAVGITYIAFEGFEIISHSGEEVKNPGRNLPRATFLSIGIVVVLYILLAITIIGGVIPPEGGSTWEFIGEMGESAIVEAARQFIPFFGTLFLLIGGLVAMLSSVNAAMFASSRVSFAMGRDRVLPSIFGKVHKKRRTPHYAIIISGIIVVVLGFLPIETIASSACILFLITFLFVNIALIALRRKYPHVKRGYKVPLYPLPPIMGILSQIFVAFYMYNYVDESGAHIGYISWVIAIIWIEIGLVLYFLYRGRREIEKIEEFKPMIGLIPKVSKEKYHVLLPIADTQDTKLVEFSALVAKVENANMTLLNIIDIPKTLPINAVGFREVNDKIKALEHLKKGIKREKIKVRAKVTISHTIAETIIDEVKDEHINLLVLGWRGYRTRGRMMGTNIDYIAQNAPCDVVVFKTKGYEKLKKILVLSGVEWHVSYATGYAILLAKKYGAEITILSVISHDGKLEEAEKYSAKLEALCRTHNVPFTTNIIKTKGIVSRVVNEAKNYDLLAMGASAQWRLKKYVFGYTQDRIARKVDCPVLMFRKVRR